MEQQKKIIERIKDRCRQEGKKIAVLRQYLHNLENHIEDKSLEYNEYMCRVHRRSVTYPASSRCDRIPMQGYHAKYRYIDEVDGHTEKAVQHIILNWLSNDKEYTTQFNEMQSNEELWSFVKNLLFSFLPPDTMQDIFLHIHKTKKSRTTESQKQCDDVFNRKAWIDYLNICVSQKIQTETLKLVLEHICYVKQKILDFGSTHESIPVE